MDKIIKCGYILIGVLAGTILLIYFIGKNMETSYAYKFPAKVVHKKEYIYLDKKTDKKESIIATGNAKKEEKPDGTNIISADKIEVKKEEKTEEVKKEKTESSETTKPTTLYDTRIFAAGAYLNPFNTLEIGLIGKVTIFNTFELFVLLQEKNFTEYKAFVGIMIRF